MVTDNGTYQDLADGQANELMEIRDRFAELYEATRAALRTPRCRGVDLILMKHPIKRPFLEIYDNLTTMAAEIRRGKWYDG